MKDAIVFDTETTGLTLPSVADLSAQPRIIELGAARVRDGKVVKTLSQLINPGVSISEEITKITGLTDAAVKDAPTFQQYYKELAKFMSGAEYLICHNAPFDTAMLAAECARMSKLKALPPPTAICTVQEFYHLRSARLKLVDLYEMTLGRPLAQKHRALDDVLALVEILDARDFWSML